MSDNALGWVSVPFVPVFDGITQRIEKGMVKPMTAGSKKAADAVQKTADDMVKSLERQAAASKKKVDSLGKAAEDAAGKEEVARRKVQAAIAKQKAAEEDYQKALAKGESGSKELSKLEDAKAKVTEATIKAKKAEQDSTDAQKKAKDQAEDYAKTVGKLEDAQKSAKDEEDRHKGVLGGLRKEMDKAKAAADEAGTSFHDIGAKLKTGMAAAAGAVAGGLAGLVKVGTTFDNTWDTVRAGTGATGEAFEALKENIRNVAKESVGVGGDFEAIGSTAADLNTRLGLTGKPLEDMTRSMMQLQELGVDADINSLSQAMNGFGVEAEDMPAMLDKMFQVSQATGLSVSELANSAVKAGPSLRGFGFDMADSAALVGQMDKAGLDADKTLQSMQRALAEFASEGRDAPEALKETIGSIEELINAGDEAAAIDMASNIFGTRGAAQFVDAVKTGTLSVDDFMAATGATSDTINGVAEETASFAEKWDQFKLNALAALEPVASKIFDSIAPAMQLVIDKVMPLAASFAEQLGPVLEDVVGKLTSLGEWILKNKDYLVPLLAAVGTAIGLWKAWALGMTAVTTALKLAKAAQEGMNLAMKANVIGIVVTAIAALAAGLVWFFTKTETGRELWEKFTAALVDGWQWVSEKFSEVWGWIQNNVLNPMVDLFQNVLWPAIQSVIGWIGEKWTWLSETLSTVWSWIYDNVIQLMVDGFNRLWDAVSAVAGWISDKWNWLYGVLLNVWNWLDENVIQRQIQGFHLMWDAVLAVAGWIADKWQWMADRLRDGWVWIDENVFSPLKSGLDTVKGWFSTAVDAIGQIWDGIKEKTKAPVQFVVDVVYNSGIRKAWNAVAGLVGLDKLKEIKFATGGILPGYTPGRDPYTFIEPRTGMRIGLSGGEGILRPEATRALGKDWLDNVNAAARQGGVEGVRNRLKHSHFASGGVIDLGNFAKGGFTNIAGALSAIQQSHAKFVSRFFPGLFTLTSASRSEPGSMHDFSRAAATDWQASDGQYATQMPTPASKALARAIHKNFPNTTQLIHHPLDGWQNLLNGAPFDYGAGTNSQHGNHVHWGTNSPLRFDGDDIVLDDVPGGTSYNPVSMVKSLWDSAIKKIGSFPGADNFGDWGKLPGAYLKTMAESAWNFIKEKADKLKSAFTGGGARNVQEWAPAATEALRRAGYDNSALQAMLEQIAIESNGDPNAVNNWDDNAVKGTPSGGLLQVIEPTYRGMRNKYPEAFEGLPDNRMDPVTNMTAALLWTKTKYGGPSNVWPTRGGYALGGVIDLPKLFDQGGWLEHGKSAVNLSGKPEPVLNFDQWKMVAQMIRSGASMGDVVRELGRLVPQLKQQTEVFARFADNAQAWMAKAGDYNSIEGINARQGVRRMLDLGLDLPGSDVIKTVLDGEEALWDSRARATKNLDTIVEKEKALEEARKAASDLMSGPEGMSKSDKRKLDDAQKAVDEAKAKQAEADSDEKRAKAADKVADAEEKLKRVREDIDEHSEENAKKHAEEVKKANEEVSKAEQELATARRKQAEDLDNVVLISQQQIESLIPQAEALASKLVGMGAPAGAVGAGLDMVVGKLASIAGLAGPTGLTLGMAMDMLKVGIGIIKSIVGAIVDLIHRIQDARIAAVKTLADGLQVVADYAELNLQLQANVAELQQQLVRGLNEQRVAAFNLEIANRDRMVAEAEGMLAIAQARMKLDGEIEKGAKIAQLKMMGLHEDWDSYNAFQAQVGRGVLAQWSDAALSALFTYEKARAEAFQKELNAKLSQLEAEYELAERVRQNARTQADLITAQERVIKMAARISGMDLEGATGQAQIAKLMAEMAENQKNLDNNVFGRWGYKLGASGSHATEYRGQLARQESLRAALDAVARETNISIDEGRFDSTLKKMSRTSFRGGDPMSVLRSEMPELVAAETALKVQETMKPIWDIRDQKRDIDRASEDFRAEVDHFEKTQPLKEQIKGLDYAIRGLEASSAAFAEGNEKVRGEYLAVARANQASAESLGVRWKMDPRYASAHDQVRRETTVVMRGDEMYTADQVDRLLADVTSGTNASVKTRISSSLLANARRKELR
ncbi:phage tail tape measure protein [Corynebacterium minutissimum]|uniref:Immunity-specific protein Beta241 n=1 Tax=Corynebacterium minutissimum TaxID=38301 RepID=A0A376CVR1_9CORY|nr:phage tail tape measure protein [Corynebacterium minutissimum]QRP60595.1 phage tail tape measure protein [Corynebacterium minutissimum]STC76459.1 immunity-specific protein Beta241 [Corynebacterium minutissimum]